MAGSFQVLQDFVGNYNLVLFDIHVFFQGTDEVLGDPLIISVSMDSSKHTYSSLIICC
jgi:hypothetical protein